MFTQGTQNYGLPQWLPQEKPTWLGDMNSAFLNIDTNLKSVSDTALLAQNSAVQAQAKIGTIDFSQIASTLSGAVVELANRISNILSRLGEDNISQLGTSITNAIVNIGANITTLTNSVNGILTKIGSVIITEVGTSITDAILNLYNLIKYSDGTQVIYTTYTCAGYMHTASRLYLSIIFPKKYDINKTINISGKITLMQNGILKYLDEDDGTYKNFAGIEVNNTGVILNATLSKISDNAIYVQLDFKNALKTSNNQNITAYSITEFRATDLTITIT